MLNVLILMLMRNNLCRAPHTLTDSQVGYGQWPWNEERLSPVNLTVSTESIVNAFGQLPQCQVTVQVSSTWNASSPAGLVSAVVILVFQNWYAPVIINTLCTIVMYSVFRII